MPRHTNKWKVSRSQQRLAKRARLDFEAILAEHYGIYCLADLQSFPEDPPEKQSERPYPGFATIPNSKEVQA